jgi:ATP-binding cassette subfamily B multidrug efflux pump
MSEYFKPAINAFHIMRPYISRYKSRLLFGFFCLVGVDILQLVVPRITKKAFDGLEQHAIDGSTLLRFALYLIALSFFIAFFRFGWRYLVLGFSRLFERDLREKLFTRLLLLDRSFFLRNPPGNIMALSSNDLSAVQLACGMGLIAAADALFMGIATICFMTYIHPHLTLLAVLPMPLLAILTLYLSARLHTRFRLVQEQFEKLTEFARTSLSTIRLLKAYTQESPQTSRFATLGKEYIDHNMKLAAIQGTLWPFSGLIANCCLLIIVFYGGRLTIAGRITIGDFVAFMSYLYMLTWPMMAIGWVTNLFQRGITSLDRLQHIYRSEPVLTDPQVPISLHEVPSVIELRHLRFRYPTEELDVLHDISAVFPRGITGVTGRTGSGKTSLASVLTRTFPIEKNQFFINGIDVCRLSVDAVRSQTAYVPQESLLFADTIAANLGYGMNDCSKEEMEEIARLVMIHDEIADMPDGYQTVIGERGVQLSGGQRQRIALGRALLLKRPILIIDDGLSAVDAGTEQAILENCLSLFNESICLFISHRLEVFTDAQQILVMENGRIEARGRHEDLMRSNRFYRTIYLHQMSSPDQGGESFA